MEPAELRILIMMLRHITHTRAKQVFPLTLLPETEGGKGQNATVPDDEAKSEGCTECCECAELVLIFRTKF